MSVRKSIPSAFQTLFADLVQKVYDAPVAGSVYQRERDGLNYVYAKIPVGTSRIDSFIGRSDDENTQLFARQLRLGMEQRSSNRKTVSLLRNAGFASIPPPIGAILDSAAHAGLFNDGAVLIGTAAYMLCEAHVGHFLPETTLMTGDVDLATADLALKSEPVEPMIDILRRADPSFEPVMQIDPRKPPSRFRSRRQYFVDLVTPVRRKTDRNPLPVKGLGAGAAPLQFLDWLIDTPLKTIALHDSGVPVRIPRPERLAVHKLILAQSRPGEDRLKRDKDLRQADALMTALYSNDPFALEETLADARGHGKRGWSQRIDRSLAELERRNAR